MGSFDMKLDGRKFKQARRNNSRRSRHSSFFILPPLTVVLIITTIITVILGLNIMLFTSLIPNQIHFSLFFELASNIYNQIFTPFYLFFLLNLLIISIFVMTLLRTEASRASPHRQSSLARFDHEMHPSTANHAEDPARFAGVKLYNDYGAEHDFSSMPQSNQRRRQGDREKHRFGADHAEDQARFAGIKLYDFDAAEYDLAPLAQLDQLCEQGDREINDDLRNLPRSDQLRRRGDQKVNPANSSDFMHSHEISAAKTLMAAESDSVYTAVDKKLPDHCSADNDPDVQVNLALIKEAISEAKLQINAAETLNEDPAPQKSKKEEFHDEDDPTSRTEEDEKAADHDSPPAGSADSLIISKQNSLLISEEAPITLRRERPLASSHFMHRKATNRLYADMPRSNSPLKISRPSVKRGDTLDATWKAICDDKLRHSSPHSRHHIASHTWKGEHHVNVKKMGATNKTKGSPLSPSKEKNHMPTSSSSGLMKKRELSIPRDELNARVESFISRFNQQIRIQREQSLLNYTNMVNRGTH